jgi:hypothetical protein
MLHGRLPRHQQFRAAGDLISSQKKTRQTAKADIDLGRQRYRQMTEFTRGGEAQ